MKIDLNKYDFGIDEIEAEPKVKKFKLHLKPKDKQLGYTKKPNTKRVIDGKTDN